MTLQSRDRSQLLKLLVSIPLSIAVIKSLNFSVRVCFISNKFFASFILKLNMVDLNPFMCSSVIPLGTKPYDL